MSPTTQKFGLRLAADLDVMWADLPILDRIDAAGAAGFEGVALSAPYDMPAKELQRALLRTGVSLVRIATPPPNYTGGARGFAATPGGEDRFQNDLRRALRYCTVLQIPMLQLLAGPGESVEARSALRSNLEHAAEVAPVWAQFVIGPEQFAKGALRGSDDCIGFLREIDARQLAVQLPCALTRDSLIHSQQAVQSFGSKVAAFILDTEPDQDSSLSLSNFAEPITQAGFKGWLIAAHSSEKHHEDALRWMA